MHLGNIFTLLCLGTGALSFKIRAFTGPDCSGSEKDINIWDNTCRGSGLPKTVSFRVLEYGAHRQRAGFYSDGSCNALGREWIDWWADGGSDTFIKGHCVNLGFGAWSMGSRSV